MKLRNKVALVTGGSQGIGEAIARRLAAEGAAVAIVARNVARAGAVAAEIEAEGGTARAFAADCTKVAEIEGAVAAIADAFGRLDIVVNCAGALVSKPLEETSETDWDTVFDLNVRGAFFLVKAVVPKLLAAGGGRIILTSSIAGLRGFPNASAYCASKAGVINLTRALATELTPKGININTIAPGNVETAMNAHLREPGNEAYRQMLRDRSPTGRDALVPGDLSGVAAFLASDDARAMHGAVVVVDDGWCAS